MKEKGQWEKYIPVTKMEFRDILMARMAGGDLYASEELRKVKSADIILDRLRITPIYSSIKPSEKKSPNR